MAGSHALPEPTTDIEQWREQICRRVAVVMVLLAAPLILAVELQWPIGFALRTRIFIAAIYGAIAAAALVPRVSPRTRAMIIVTAGYTLALAQLARAGLIGDGRVTLATMPLFATVMLGNRSGWICATVSTAAYLAAMASLNGAWWRSMAEGASDQQSVSLWGIMGVAMALHMFVAMILVTLLLSKQERSIVTEREIAGRLREEMGEREAAHEALENESRERRRLEHELQRVGIEDRRLMAAEVHDGLCQQLTAAMLRATAAEVAAGSSSEASDDLKAIRQILGRCVEDAYALMNRLTPVEMPPDSLPHVLKELAEQARECSHIRCHVEIGEVPGELEPLVVLHLYRIAQESVRNAIRHAQASAIQLRLHQKEQELILQIGDDGCGLAGSRGQGSGTGMRTMQYRATLLGARLDVRSGSEGGMMITCTYPLDKPSPGECNTDSKRPGGLSRVV